MAYLMTITLLNPLLLSALILAKLLVVHAANVTSTENVVTLDYGTFAGLVNTSTGIVSYRGVRYADAPIGSLRWRAPVSPPSKHLGHVNATQFGSSCVKADATTIDSRSSEDCLFANIYVPMAETRRKKLPVMVWFHGGGFQGGNTHITPDLMVQPPSSPIIFVSFEYRLGQFGFLGGSQVRKDGVLNAGLLDQRAALQWVRRYIENFGGDRRQVTIWGQSAGAGSTMFHLLANGGNSDGLFRAAIGDSPPFGFLPSFNDDYIEELFRQFSTSAGCGDAGGGVMDCLRSVNGNKLALAGSQTIAARTATLFPFAPLLDGVFLRDRPVEAFTAGKFAKVPVIFGANTDDGAHWSTTLPDPSANTSMPNATQTTVYNFLQGQWPSLTRVSFDRAVTEFYPLSDYGNFSLQGQQMYGEARYICSASLIVGAAFNRGLPGYQYRYYNPLLGSNHKAELDAFFSSPPADKDSQSLFVSMRNYWTSFVADGEPSPGNSSAPSWEAASRSDGSPRLLLQPGNLELENLSKNQMARCTFWHSISGELKV